MQTRWVMLVILSVGLFNQNKTLAATAVTGPESSYWYGATTVPTADLKADKFKSVSQVWGSWWFPFHDEYVERGNGSTRETQVWWNDDVMNTGWVWEFNDGSPTPESPQQTSAWQYRPVPLNEMAAYVKVGQNGLIQTRYAETRQNLFILGGRPGKSCLVRVTFTAVWYDTYPGATFPGDINIDPAYQVLGGLSCATGGACDAQGSVLVWIKEDGEVLDITPSLPGFARWAYTASAEIILQDP